MKPLKSLTVSTAILFAAIASSASAVTISTDKIQPSYTGLLAAPTASSGDFRLNYVGSDLDGTSPNSRTPWEDFVTLADSAYYNSVEAGGFADYVFDTAQTSFSLMWGSPDSYNKLSFLDANDEVVFSMAGDDAAIQGTVGYVESLSFVNVTVSDLSFFTARFESIGQDAFEFANVSPVPLPAAGWMLIAGLGGLGAIGRRRKAKKA